MPSPTPGQIAYAAYCLFWCTYGLGERALVPWSARTPETHDAWEAAAQAVQQDIPRYTVEYDENGCAWVIEQATSVRLALCHGMTLRIAQLTLPAYQRKEDPHV